MRANARTAQRITFLCRREDGRSGGREGTVRAGWRVYWTTESAVRTLTYAPAKYDATITARTRRERARQAQTGWTQSASHLPRAISQVIRLHKLAKTPPPRTSRKMAICLDEPPGRSHVQEAIVSLSADCCLASGTELPTSRSSVSSFPPHFHLVERDVPVGIKDFEAAPLLFLESRLIRIKLLDDLGL